MLTNTVIDFKVIEWKDALFSSISTYITLILKDNTEVNVDCIKISDHSYKNIKQHLFKDTIHILNEIYSEYIKLVMLGSGYPVYQISYAKSLKDNHKYIICSLSEFNTTHGSIKSYKVRKFVDKIHIEKEHNINIEELVIDRPIDADSFGATTRLKVKGIEYIESLTDRNLDVINYNVKLRDDKTLTLRNLKIILCTQTKVYDIEKIVLENSCTIKGITTSLFNQIKSLNKLVLNNTVESIDGYPLEECLRVDKEGIHFNVDAPTMGYWVHDSDRLVRIRFQDKEKENKLRLKT